MFSKKIPAYIDIYSYWGDYAKSMYNQILAEKRQKARR